MRRAAFAVVGGDDRNRYAAALLREAGFASDSFALGGDSVSALGAALEGKGYVLGPIPFTKDGRNINAPSAGEDIPIDGFLAAIGDRKLFTGGVTSAAKEILTRSNVDWVDLTATGDLLPLNAIPTAEGAIKLAIENAPTTIHNAEALVIGYGNVGKALAKRLAALGAVTSVTSRRSLTDAEIFADGYNVVGIVDLPAVIGRFGYIFNTVPSRVVTDEAVDALNPNALYIELASAPYGIDKDAANLRGVTVVIAPGLPGKIAPLTTAGYIVGAIKSLVGTGGLL